MDFALTTEQKLLVDSVRRFVEQELYPYEDEVERSARVREELVQQIRRRAIEDDGSRIDARECLPQPV